MGKRLLWKIGGEAGFGIMTTGLTFSKIASRTGYNIFDYVEYPSLIRGGHNTYEVLVSEDQVNASQRQIDILVCLNKATYELHKGRLHDKSVVVYDSDDFQIEESAFQTVTLPLRKILKEYEAPIVMMNNVALAASLALMGWSIETLHEVIELTFAKKGENVVSKNKKLAQAGFDHVSRNYGQVAQHEFPVKKTDRKLVLSGNESFSLSTVASDCRLYAAYPMTPASSVLTNLAKFATKTGMVVRHAEDEVAVVNTAIGASWAGVRSACGTSGGGFALMVESLSYAGAAEIPLVVFLVQRPGPATGMPTWTEQGDLLFCIRAGHGEFPKIVLAAGDIKEMYELTAKAFDLADIYQTPVIILSDKMLSESRQTTPEMEFKLFAKSLQINRGKIVREPPDESIETNKAGKKKYLRYKLTDDGISPMLVPGLAGQYYQSNSYEHVEDGHTTEESQSRVEQVTKRLQKKQTYLKNHFVPPMVIGNINTAKTVFVSWGSCKGAILEAMRVLKESGKETAYIHFTHLHPLDELAVRKVFEKDRHYVLVENNSLGQLGLLLRKQTGVHIEDRLLKFDGRPFWPSEIIKHVNSTGF